jgi:O-methyltransferase involved in polyketide biosynthesis
MPAMSTPPGPDDDDALPVIDTSRAHPARMYDWLLGGKDNYPVDEALGRQMEALEPGIKVMTKVNRAFTHRATRWLAAQGFRQFLDIGTGIPTRPNLHQVAQEIAPEARVVYCDNDPVVLRHAEALLRGTEEGELAYLQADVRDTGHILEQAAKKLDFDSPVAVSLNALLHFLTEEDGPYGIVERLIGALAPGSAVVISHGTMDFVSEGVKGEEVRDAYNDQAVRLTPRTRDEIARFLDGLDLVEPGLVAAHEWRPELGEPVARQDEFVAAFYSAVALKA